MGEKDCLFQKALELILQKRTLKKREKRILCKSSEGFQNFPFLPIVNMIFPFALSSPLWHSWYISLLLLQTSKLLYHIIFANPLDCEVMMGLLSFPRVWWVVD